MSNLHSRILCFCFVGAKTEHFYAGLGIRSFAHCSFAHLLILLKSNEQLWAIRSDRSRQMSDHEQIAQVTQRKWTTLSASLRTLKTNERRWAIRSGRSEKMSKWAIGSKKCWLQKSKILFLVCFITFMYVFFLNVLKKWANCSFPLFWWAMWVNR